MVKRYRACHQVRNGDIISILPEKNERSHTSQELVLGIAFDPTSTGTSAFVATEWGTLGAGRTATPYPVPCDKMNILHRNTTMSAALKEIRSRVIKKEFDELRLKRVTLKNAQVFTLGHDFKRRGNCRCKNGNCTARCGCYKANIHCSSSCSCGGKCERKEK